MNVSAEELVMLMENFIQVTGMQQPFKDYVETQGYTLEQLGFKDEDE